MIRRTIAIGGDMFTGSVETSESWLASVTQTLSLTDSMIHVVLPASETAGSPLSQLTELHNVVLHPAATDSTGSGMTPGDVVARLEGVITETGASILIVNGNTLAQACGRSDTLSSRLWSHVAGIRFPMASMSEARLVELREIAATSRRLLVQTEQCRSFVESIMPEAAGKCLLMPPTVPDHRFVDLESAPAKDIRWRGGLSAEKLLDEVAIHDIGLDMSSAIDDPLGISTTVLEYAASGTPPMISRTPAYEALLGSDYPLFVDNDHIDTAVSTLLNARGRLSDIGRGAQEAVRPYARTAAASRLEVQFRHYEPNRAGFPFGSTQKKVVLAGHDMKFAGDLIELLETRPDIELRIDRFAGLLHHDELASQKLVDWADIIICEWAGQNAVWYSQHKRPDQRLVVRLHRYEVTGSWIENIDMDEIDAVITISPHYHHLVRESPPWPRERTHYIPNSLDAMDLDRPKYPDATHALAIVGIVPFLKRPDRALDLLETLLRHDPHFVLHIKGRMPWEYPWAWKDPVERESYLDFFGRIGNTPGLPEHVVFAPFSPDMANWLRGIGWVLSPSTQESFHLAPAEGMASGALPVFWPRGGVADLFGDEYLFTSIDEIASFVLETVNDEPERSRRVDAVKEQALAFDAATVADMWMSHILPPAQK